MIHVTRLELINGTKSKPLPINRKFETHAELEAYRTRVRSVLSRRAKHDLTVVFAYKELDKR
jgi:hypothetical protein